MTHIIGKKVIIDPMHPNDISLFVKLHREDKNGYLQRFCLKKMNENEAIHYVAAAIMTKTIIPYTVITKEGKASKIAGFMYITGFTKYSCELNGVMDKEFAKGLGRLIRKDKYTYSEDAIRTIVNHIFMSVDTMNRIVFECIEANRPAVKLAEKAGFKREGVLRDYFYMDDTPHNVVVHSVLKKEWEKEHEHLIKKDVSSITGIYSANAVLV